MQRLIDANAVKENHKRWIGYLDDDMIGRMNFAIDHHVPTVLTIPENPTNGDMIMAMFPNFKFNEEWKATRHFELQSEQGHIEITGIATSDWWNAPYKRGTENG